MINIVQYLLYRNICLSIYYFLLFPSSYSSLYLKIFSFDSLLLKKHISIFFTQYLGHWLCKAQPEILQYLYTQLQMILRASPLVIKYMQSLHCVYQTKYKENITLVKVRTPPQTHTTKQVFLSFNTGWRLRQSYKSFPLN